MYGTLSSYFFFRNYTFKQKKAEHADLQNNLNLLTNSSKEK